uniref:RNase H type-1 domain-containing protein n=1 Tax=Brassica oleracea TaxID=3712 RepID=A0A3P6H2C7_BRAOL|nr:unnamed protein product [Brassica oleracea]
MSITSSEDVDLGNGMYEEPKTVSGYVCNGLFSIDIKLLRRSFLNSDIIHVSRTENQRADSVARSARKQPSFVVHMDAELPIWFTKSI